MKDYIAGKARLGLEPVRFVATGRGTSHFTTALHLTGPLPGGGLKGLTLPIDGLLGIDGTVRVTSACTPLEFLALKYESMTLGMRWVERRDGKGWVRWCRSGWCRFI